MICGHMLIAIAGDDDDYAKAKREIVDLSTTAHTRRELPGAWGVDVGPVQYRDDSPRAVVKISQHGYLVDVFIVAKTPRGGEFEAPLFTRFDRTAEYPLFAILIDFASDDDGGGIEQARAA